MEFIRKIKHKRRGFLAHDVSLYKYLNGVDE
jgi:hypothetical protein